MITQLQKAATDLSEVLIMQWIRWIQLFNFEVRHVLKKKYTAADKFSKWLKVERETNDIENINKFIDAELNVVRILILVVEKK